MAKELSFIEKLKKELVGVAKVTALSDPANEVQYEPSGILMLDWIAGRGLPRGRWIEIFGMESGGKSLLAALIAASYQRRGETVVWIDMERSIDPVWYKRLGLDTDSLIVAQPDSGEGAFETLQKVLESGQVGLVVIDSIASMATDDELEEEAGHKNMAILARLLSNELRKLNGKLADSKCTVILINQVRSTMALTRYSANETTTGGKALPFYASLRFRVTKSTEPGSYIQDENGKYMAHTIKIKNIKNKTSSPNLTGQFMLIYDGGPDNRAALVALATEKGYITTAPGGWYYINFNGQKIAKKGEKALIEALAENKDLQNFLFDALNVHKIYRNMFEIDKREVISASGLAEIAKLPEEEEVVKPKKARK